MNDAPPAALIAGHENVALDSLTPHPDNARRGDAQAIERSLRAHGQYAPLVVQHGTRLILKGNNTYRVMSERLGWTHAEVTWVKCDEAQARAILAVDNRTTDGAGYDDEALANLLQALSADSMLSAGGYTETDLDDLLAALEEVEPPRAEPLSPPDPQDDGGVITGRSRVGIDARKAGGYQDAALRYVMLTYPAEEYPAVVDGLSALGERWGIVDDNSAVVARALRELVSDGG